MTYTRYNAATGLTYAGRTSAVIDLNLPWRPQAIAAMRAREAKHHIDDRPDAKFDPAVLDKFAVGSAVDYSERYRDIGYLAIRGREQQLIDDEGAKEYHKLPLTIPFNGGAWSDTPSPHLTENDIRGVAKEQTFWGPIFHAASNLLFGTLAPYTGN